jgi:hypothetical protein
MVALDARVPGAHGSAGDDVDAPALAVTASDASGFVVDDPAAMQREVAQGAVGGGPAVEDAAALATPALPPRPLVPPPAVFRTMAE